MAHNEKLAADIRQALSHLHEVEEKKMFGGLAFMVNHKMCITVSDDRMMCRIDPDIHEEVLKTKKCSTVIMRGGEYKGYIQVDKKNVQTKVKLNYWVELALDFNQQLNTSGS